ncbi:response regulator transcription factor [Sphingobium sp. EM0848]|uniref:response regulator transcription factor n=1 Tax=Sphingobium sp. EM0848 TaxID=2743473 RepID=UPI00159C6DCE|nr:response regulator [Sphingobium sp. EM0848]
MTDDASKIYVVDDDCDLGASVARLLRRHGFDADSFLDPVQLLDVYVTAPAHCIVTDVMMGDLDGFAFADQIRVLDPSTAIIFMTAWPTTANAVDSVRRYGGLDYLEKPIDEERLLAAAREGIDWACERRRQLSRTAALTPRERQVFELLILGHSNKVIAAILGLSPKTVEDHRASVMGKTGVNGLAQLIALGG